MIRRISRSESRGDAAVHSDALAGDERSGVAGKEDHDTGNFFRLPPTAQRGTGIQPARPFRIPGEVGIDLGGKCSGRDETAGDVQVLPVFGPGQSGDRL